jgi:translocation and assembly module TamB
MQTEVHHKPIALKIARIILKTVLFLLLFVVVIFLLILTPPVQKFLTARAESFLENKLQTRVDIGSVGFGLSGRIHLKDIYIEDRTKDTLVSGGTIKARLALMKLLNSELEINDLVVEDLTAKIKRVLPDTTFNFQFIVDAFAPKTTTVDTTTSAPLKMALNKFNLENIVFQLADDVTGNNMRVRIGAAEARMDSINPSAFYYDIPSVAISDLTAVVKQTKPLATPEPPAKDVAEAAAPQPMQLRIGDVTLSKINLDYANDVSAFYTVLNLGRLHTTGRKLDMTNNTVMLEDLILENTTAAIRMGKTAAAKVVAEEVKQEVDAQQTQGWNVRVGSIRLNNNNIKFDNDNEPRLTRGMDYAHLDAKGLTLHADNFIMSTDTIATRITRGQMEEKSGFTLQELRGDLLYAYNGAHLKDLYIKTPGTELKRDLVLKYSSYEALTNNFPATRMEIDIDDSRVQVKDILTFVPTLAAQPAFRNANDVWRMDLEASGTVNNLLVNNLNFDGFGNTAVRASGRLTNLMNPSLAGADFTLQRLHTTRADLELLSGGAIPKDQISLPESIDLDGTIKGNMGRLATNMNLRTSAGSAAIKGNFANITDPVKAQYNATVRTAGLRLGQILRNPQIGTVSATFSANGTGLDPKTIRTNFKGNIASAGFNGYTYRNISMDGKLNGQTFSASLNSRDANAAFALDAAGDFNGTPSLKLNGMIDSVKTLPLGFTTQPLVFRGRIVGDMPSLDPANLEADVLITEMLLVSGTNRLPLDTLALNAGRTDSGQFVRINSDIIRAELEGQYQLAELGSVFQHNLAPYINMTPGVAIPKVQLYDFAFNADIAPSELYAAFVPGLNITNPIHMDGRLATASGMQANVRSDQLVFGGNTLMGINVRAATSAQGLQLNGQLNQVKAGGLQLFRTTFNATALNNNINFGLNLEDKQEKDKYRLAGLFQMQPNGVYRLSLAPDSLLLNYDRWMVAANNQILVTPDLIRADNFTLSKDGQSLAIQSAPGSGVQPLTVTFNDFRVATLTGFVQTDSLLADGVIDGSVRFAALPKQMLFTSDLTIANLSMQRDTIGDLRLQVLSNTANRYEANITLGGRGNDARITGTMTQLAEDIGLDLDVDLQRLQLSNFEGAMAAFVRKADGNISGKISIDGTASKPDIDGALRFNDVSLVTIPLGGPLRIDDEEIRINNEGLTFDKFAIRDSANQAFTIDGAVRTTDFTAFGFDLNINANDFRALSTTKKANDLYYGNLYISTRLHIGGSMTEPKVDGTLSVNEKTDFTVVIPQTEASVATREGIVQFLDFDAPLSDSLFKMIDTLNKSELVGFDVAVNLSLSKLANFNVVVDPANGDFLNIKGEGQLSAGVDPSGKITMTGTYTVSEGAYRFSFNFLQRRFELQQGSTITWLGEPTNAQLDMTAIYVANTSALDLVADQVDATERGYYMQKLPFQVLLNLDGELLKPQLTFDIQLPKERNYTAGGDVVETVNYRLTQLRQEPSELNKQVFSILLLNRFVGENPFQSESGGGGFNAETFARQSVSKLLTEQLNNLAGDLIAGVDLNFGVSSSDDYTTGDRRTRTDLNVGLSKRLLNDRLTVSVGSDFLLEGAQQNQKSSNIAGNLAVNYQLSRDGRYALRFYRRNDFEGVVDGYIIETGLGFIMTVDYNRLNQIFESTKKREERRKQRRESNATERPEATKPEEKETKNEQE